MFANFLRRKRAPNGVEIEDSIMTVTQEEKALVETPFRRRGLDIFWYAVIILVAMLFGRVFYLDIVRGAYYAELSKGNRIRSLEIKAPRGKIYDRQGRILVSNVPSIDVVIVPRDLPQTYDDRLSIAGEISAILNMEQSNVEILMESQDRNSLDPVLLKENISEEQALILSERISKMPGVDMENTAIRNYESSTIFSHIIGYDGKITREELADNLEYSMTDYIGKSGIEKYYEKYLKGKNGDKQVEVDALGNIKKNLGIINPQSGQDLVLNIDEGLQKKLYDSMAKVLEETGTRTAAAVAIDPRDGGVLALVSLPSYDNNLFAAGISSEDYQNISSNQDLPLFNRVVAGAYPPGSTFKPLMAAAALAENTISSDTVLNDNGGAINIGSFRFGDWKTHGTVNVRTAIAESCDVFFYAVGGGYGNIAGLGMDRIKKYANLFGLGRQTGIDLPGEVSGLIPDEQWKKDKIGERWYVGDSYHAGIGQGYVTATPVQLASYIAAIANGGKLYSPRLLNRIKNFDGQERFIEPVIVRQNMVSDSVLQVIREGMRQTVVSGTAQSLNNLPVEVAGKTGTAQFGNEDKTHGWFVSFAPYDEPEIVMVVLAEGGGEGHSTGVPITREVYEWYFNRQK